MFEIPNPLIRRYQSTLRELRILHPFMTAQIFVVFQIWCFLICQSFSESETSVFLNLKFLTLHLVAVWVLIGVVNFASKYGYSNICTFRDSVFFKLTEIVIKFFLYKISNYQPCNWLLSVTFLLGCCQHLIFLSRLFELQNLNHFKLNQKLNWFSKNLSFLSKLIEL